MNTDPTQVDDWLITCRMIAVDLHTSEPKAIANDDDSLVTLAQRLDHIDTIRRLLADVRRAIEPVAAKAMGQPYVETDDGYVLQRHLTAASVTWDMDGVMRAIKRRVVEKARDDAGTDNLVDAVTGEVVDIGPIVERAIDRTRAALTETPRVKGLKAIGITPSAFREVHGGRYMVAVTPPREAPTE